MVFILQLQLRKAAGGIPVGDDAHDLRVVAFLLGHILDALAGSHCLRYTLGVGVDAVGGNFFRSALAVHIVEIGIDQLTDAAIDGEIGEFLFSVVNIDFAQGFLLAAGGKSGGREHPQHHDHQQQHGDQSFFHRVFLLNFLDIKRRYAFHIPPAWNMKLSAYIDAVLGVLEYAVFVDIPCLHGVRPRRAGVEQLRDLFRPPRPKALWRDLCGDA